MDEWEIRSWDWDDIYFVLDEILHDRREARRWELMSRLASGSAAQGSQESFKWWENLFDHTLTRAEKLAQLAAEEEEWKRQCEADAQKRLEEAAAAWAAQQEQATGPNADMPALPTATLIF